MGRRLAAADRLGERLMGRPPIVYFSHDPTNGNVHASPDGPQLALPVDMEDHGEIRVYRIHYPFLPPSKNKYDSLPGPYQNSIKGKWIRHTVKEAQALMLPQGMLKIGLSAALIFPTSRRRDPQNYSATLWNFVPDALQRGGFLQDDRDGRIDFGRNLGIRFHVDDRPGIPKPRRERCVVSLSVKVQPRR